MWNVLLKNISNSFFNSVNLEKDFILVNEKDNILFNASNSQYTII
jgi:hypothetical protein